MQGDQRGRARGVDRDRGTLQAQRVGDAAGGDAGGVAGEQVALHAVLGVGGLGGVAVLVLGGADEDAGPAAAQRGRVDARVLQGLPRGLQQHPLLGVHGQRLAGADAEEGRVELGRVVQEAAVGDVGAARRLGVVVEVDLPAPVARHAADGVTAGLHEPPQLVGGRHTAGKTTAHADDRDGLLALAVELAQPALRVVELARHLSQVGEDLVFVGHSSRLLYSGSDKLWVITRS